MFSSSARKLQKVTVWSFPLEMKADESLSADATDRIASVCPTATVIEPVDKL